MHRVAYLSSIFALTCSAREIVFPSVAGIAGNSHQVPFELTETVDIVTGSQFSGLTTFAHLPYVNCFVDTEAENNTYDIAFLGAPFDTVSTHYQDGYRAEYHDTNWANMKCENIEPCS